MLNKLTAFLGSCHMLEPGDQVVCALSGGPDSMALVWALYLLQDKLQIHLSAAHFNHHLRGEESDRDEAFVRSFCDRYDIPLYCGSAQVKAGKKGLEAAARDARYGFLQTLPGKIATAHNADDNAETVIMRLVRGTGLKGLGAIAPVSGKLIRPMLTITRAEILEFLQQYHVGYVEDSSNGSDRFLRNRIRHQVMPLLAQENPSLAVNLSAMALRLRQDEETLCGQAEKAMTDDVWSLRRMEPAVRSRVLAKLLMEAGVKEPDAEHIRGVEQLVFSRNPSAKAEFPGGVTMSRVYGRLMPMEQAPSVPPHKIPCSGETKIPEMGIAVRCVPVSQETETGFPVCPVGTMVIRERLPGDEIRLSGGTRSLKKLFIDRKIPAAQRSRIPILADDKGVLAVYGIGVNQARNDPPTVRVIITHLHERNTDE